MTSSLNPKPSRTHAEFQRAYKRLVEMAKVVEMDSKKITNPEMHQAFIKEMDVVNKLHSDTQRELGAIRRSMGKQNESLRKANPRGKAKPNESVPFTLNGKTYQLVDGEAVLIEEITTTSPPTGESSPS